MKKIDIKKLKYKYRRIVDKTMCNILNDSRASYLKFIKCFPIYVLLFCILLIFSEIATRYNFNIVFSDIEFMVWFSVVMIAISIVYPLTLSDKFPRKYYVITGEVTSKRIESDEVTNAYFIKVNGYGKEFTSLSTIYENIKENEKNIFVVSECDNRICMVLDKLIDTETYNNIISS